MESPKIKITSTGTFRDTHVMVGDKELRVSKMTIYNDRDGYIRVELEALLPEIDIEALESNTEIRLHDLDGKDIER